MLGLSRFLGLGLGWLRQRTTSLSGEPGWGGPWPSYRREPSTAELLAAYRDTAYYCANLNAAGVARIPLRLYVITQRDQPAPKCPTRTLHGQTHRYLGYCAATAKLLRSAERVEEVVEHPLLDLLGQPCRQDDTVLMTRFDLFSVTQLYLEIVGIAYWLIERNRLDVPVCAWPLLPTSVRAVRSPESRRVVDHYEYGFGTRRRCYRPEEIVVFRVPHPGDPYHGGYSPLHAAFERIGVAQDYLRQTQSLLSNRARPDAIVSPSHPDGVIGEPEARRLETSFNNRFRGAGNGGIYVSRDSLRVDPLSFSPKDLGELAETELSINQIARAFDIPLSMLHRDSNRANAEQGRVQHANDALWPRLVRLQEQLNARLTQMFDPGGRLFLAFDDPVPENVQQKLRLREVNLRLGVTTINEERTEDGRPPVPWGDEPTTAGP